MQQQIINVSIDILKIHPRNKEFYDDIEGEAYEKFEKSIEEEGVITPLIVSPDMTIISGHQRYKASKNLGNKLIPVIIKEDLTNEDDKLRKLLATNFGRIKNNPVKQGRVYSEYEKLCGVRQGSLNSKGVSVGAKNALTQEDIAKELGISVRTIQNLKRLQTLSPELQQLIEDGSVKYTTALNVFSKLSTKEQKQMIDEIGKDELKEMTSKQIEIHIKEKQALEDSNKTLEQSFNNLSKKYIEEQNKPKEVKVKTVDNTDYDMVNGLKRDLANKTRLYNLAIEKETLYKSQIDVYEEKGDEYRELKRKIEVAMKEKNDLGRAVRSGLELSEYISDIETFLKTKLAPINYSRSLIECQDSPTVLNNVKIIVECVEKWCVEIRKYLPKEQQNIINVNNTEITEVI